VRLTNARIIIIHICNGPSLMCNISSKFSAPLSLFCVSKVFFYVFRNVLLAVFV